MSEQPGDAAGDLAAEFDIDDTPGPDGPTDVPDAGDGTGTENELAGDDVDLDNLDGGDEQ